MGLAYDKLTALAILRARRGARGRLGARRGLQAPQLADGKRWTRRAVDPGRFGAPSSLGKVYVAVPSGPTRVRTRGVVSTVYSAGLPADAFVDVGEGFSIASPELLFVELGTLMPLATQVMVGMELCGTYSRDPADPRLGNVAFGVEAVTSVERISAFVESAKYLDGLSQAREAVAYVADNAWSPMEATIATMASLPVSRFGYELGRVRLNVRTEASQQLQALGAKASRVPDVLFEGTPVGINYDGKEHFDLDGLVASVREADAGGGVDADARVLEMREKIVDDLRRTRELAAAGLVVLPATSEDLFARGGFDALMLEAMCAIEHFAGRDLTRQRNALRSSTMAKSRQRLVWSLLPWSEASSQAREMLERERRATEGMTEAVYEIGPEPGEIRRLE